MDVHDFMADSAAQVLKEVLQGDYDGLSHNIEVTEGGAHLQIEAPDGHWILSLRKAPTTEAETETVREVEIVA